MFLDLLTIAFASYLIGSVPTGVLLGRLIGVDIQAEGSGNIGATNVARTAGRRLGALTLLLDATKGAVPVLLAAALDPASPTEMSLLADAPPLAALFAVIGHIYPATLGFRGGKGVATALGAMLVLAPSALLLPLSLFGVLVATTRFVSLGSIIAVLTAPIGAQLAGYPPTTIAALAVIGALVILRHSDNIARLRAGTENRL
ncbi:MAG: glycerol-3-phosphate 1-O-acyltransferase PlsY [Deltaproteobacteria bacterium]